MGRKQKSRISTEGDSRPLEQSVFSDALDGLTAPEGDKRCATGAAPPSASPAKKAAKKGVRHRLDLRRETKGRGGRTVIVISGFPASMRPDALKTLLKQLQSACACGGSIKGSSIEIQGDHRETLIPILEAEGYRPVRTGG